MEKRVVEAAGTAEEAAVCDEALRLAEEHRPLRDRYYALATKLDTIQSALKAYAARRQQSTDPAD